jgi:hypothetical protein
MRRLNQARESGDTSQSPLGGDRGQGAADILWPDACSASLNDALMVEAKKSGWTAISMKNDWKVIFPFGSR